MSAELAVTGARPAPGSEHADDLAGHEARSAARSLAFRLTEAWDAGDEQAFAGCFTGNATASGLGARGDQGRVPGAFREYLEATSWSLHWLGNEQVSVRDGHAGGSWLWWSFEELGGGRPAYAGGDLGLVVAQASDGYRISDMEITERFRVPVEAGWLNDELPDPSAWPATPGSNSARQAPRRIQPAFPGLPPGPAADGPHASRLGVLAAERALRQLLAGLIRGLEEQAPAAELARLWSADGSYATDRGAAAGQAELAAALAAELAGDQPVMRLLGNGAVTATADRATGRWRDLWVTAADGQARWQAHRYHAEAGKDDAGEWRLRSVLRERILDAPYRVGWDGAGWDGGGGAPR